MKYSQEIIEESLRDIQEDLDLYTYILQTKLELLNHFSHWLSTSKTISDVQKKPLLSLIQTLSGEYSTLQNACTISPDIDHLSVSYQLFDRIRTLISLTASIYNCMNWESPSFNNSEIMQNGTEAGKIKESINDYKRDQHIYGRSYELMFRKAYIDSPFKFPLCVYATSSGMAALTTIIDFLKAEKYVSGPVLLGTSSYFEEKISVHAHFKNKVIEFDEHKISAIIDLVKKHKPKCIFIDSLCNNHNLAFPNLNELITELKKSITDDTYVIIDNTGLSVYFQPFKDQLFSHPKLHIICWESLIKHHQFGMDQVNGGIIYTRGKGMEKLYTYRDHLGTNIQDISALTLPVPNRKLLEIRLQRHKRNMNILYQLLPDHIIHPLSETHPAHVWASTSDFYGAITPLTFSPRHRHVSFYKKVTHTIIRRAKKNHLSIVEGTSFGLPITRIYIPASRPGQGIPFIRIAPGTEPRIIFENVASVITSVVQEEK